ncbi:MAG TPA: tripartite tricarboxylate transporter substrate binding protein [Xanthobacteraceae bacterium]|jgi:tripartite-type tricarboxylate transporter receptor subunit TctC|nr:tripartite tricarboxylate transporter substrate binding protein [Xanthobacteraceae bacterium]
MSRQRRLLAAAMAAIAVTATAVRAEDTYPSRSIQLIIPFAAGGPTDIVGRIMGAKMGQLLGQTIIVEDKAGAGGNIGADFVAKSTPDGYTLLFATVSTNAINPGLYKHMPYDAVRDFAAVGRVGVTPTLLMVNPSVPATDVKSLIALLKANPNKYNYGSSGVGSILHLCGEEFKAMAGGLDVVHVPYKGSAPMDTDLMGGQIAMAFDATPTALPISQSGRVRALGAGMLKRLAAMPDLPTLDEQGLKGFECYTWNIILAPAGTPQPIVDKLNVAINKALEDPAVIDSLKKTGVDPTPGSTPQSTADFVKAELAKWAPIIAASGAQVD